MAQVLISQPALWSLYNGCASPPPLPLPSPMPATGPHPENFRSLKWTCISLFPSCLVSWFHLPATGDKLHCFWIHSGHKRFSHAHPAQGFCSECRSQLDSESTNVLWFSYFFYDVTLCITSNYMTSFLKPGSSFLVYYQIKISQFNPLFLCKWPRR